MGNAASTGQWDWSSGQPKWKPAKGAATAAKKKKPVRRTYSSDSNDNWWFLADIARPKPKKKKKKAATRSSVGFSAPRLARLQRGGSGRH
jgi:hypothetical protein